MLGPMMFGWLLGNTMNVPQTPTYNTPHNVYDDDILGGETEAALDWGKKYVAKQKHKRSKLERKLIKKESTNSKSEEVSIERVLMLELTTHLEHLWESYLTCDKGGAIEQDHHKIMHSLYKSL